MGSVGRGAGVNTQRPERGARGRTVLRPSRGRRKDVAAGVVGYVVVGPGTRGRGLHAREGVGRRRPPGIPPRRWSSRWSGAAAVRAGSVTYSTSTSMCCETACRVDATACLVVNRAHNSKSVWSSRSTSSSRIARRVGSASALNTSLIALDNRQAHTCMSRGPTPGCLRRAVGSDIPERSGAVKVLL